VSQQFFVKLIPNRNTFPGDITPEEQQIMGGHAAYWTGLMHQKKVIAFGPVFDPAGVYGMGVVEVEDEAELRSLLDRDPAVVLNHYEFFPMRAVHPGQQQVSA
jgi:uncharacterized protein YciI